MFYTTFAAIHYFTHYIGRTESVQVLEIEKAFPLP